ncbi:hypothetical protein CRUP_038416 [Coryphaenoides rupestris]|nr:hypothetical protein CRUP_038416 [Coryphaenoides rupestris]
MAMQCHRSALAMCAAFIIGVLALPGALDAFNLDTDSVIRKHGEAGSLFGFSLAMHQQLNPDKRMLLIGAPRARALGNQRANITGGLYKCELTLASRDCERIQFDSEEDIRTENKENQWMGVTVQSQGPGGKIVTCAHRYQRRLFANTMQESRDITGRCYMLSQDLTIDTSNDEDGGNWKFCEGRARGHERFGSCQQGLAATFTKDYHYVVMEQKNNTLLEMGIYDDGPFEVGDENLLDPNLVPVPANSYLAPRAHHSGAVVLLKKENEASTRLSPEFILQGPGLASSFGYDVAVVDLNGDGWQDIVVGAPQFFLKDGDVGGAVYVYINQAGKWNRVTPVRLNGTKDSMFDIAVGAPYEDTGVGKVFIFHGSAQGVTTKPAQILSAKQNNIQLFGYSLAGNMDLDGNSYPDLAVAISYTIEAEGYRRKQGLLSRVVFLDKSATDQDYQSSGTLDLRGQNKRTCIKAKVKLQDNIKDKLRGIPVEVSVAVVGTKRHKRQHELPGLVPILDPSQPSKMASEVNFLKEGCGSDNVCQSNLQLHVKFCSKESNQDKKDLALQVTVRNRDGDDAHEARLLGTFPDSLSYSGFREKQVICIANQNGSLADCDLGNPLKRDSEAMFYIILSTAGISLDTTEISIGLQLQTTSTQEGIAKVSANAKVVIELSLSVTGVARPSQVYFGGAVRGESAVTTEEEIGSLINYEFRITNLGKPLRSFGSASLNILWPKENFDGKWLLYLVKVTSTGLAEVPCSPETEINALEHIQMCGNGYDARCVVIKCPLQGLDSTAVISLRSRLWNSTFLENYASLSYLDIIVKASLKLDSPAKNMILRNADTQYGGVPWWIILVSVLAGILMLALLVLLLWKCGFFNRSKRTKAFQSTTPSESGRSLFRVPTEKSSWAECVDDNLERE